MMNRVVLVGRLTKDPDLRYTPQGVAVANFTIAINRPFSNQQGDREADFINCVVWRRPAENLANYMNKGSLIGVDGRVQSRNFEGQDGKRVFVTEVVADSVQFLESKKDNNQNQQQNQQPSRQYNQTNPYQNNGKGQQNPQGKSDNPFENQGKPIDISDDDLPF
nr:single-stranded DNA-binding protein [Oceanobacillus oncorhynchi]